MIKRTGETKSIEKPKVSGRSQRSRIEVILFVIEGKVRQNTCLSLNKVTQQINAASENTRKSFTYIRHGTPAFKERRK